MSHDPPRLPPLANPYATVERPTPPGSLVTAAGVLGIIAGSWLSGAAPAAADPTSDPGDVVGEDSFGGHTPDFEVPDPTMAPDPPATAGIGVSTPSVRTDPVVLPTPTDISFQIHDGVTLTPLTEADLGVVPDLDSVDRPEFGVTGPTEHTELLGQPDLPDRPTDLTAEPPTPSSDPVLSREIEPVLSTPTAVDSAVDADRPAVVHTSAVVEPGATVGVVVPPGAVGGLDPTTPEAGSIGEADTPALRSPGLVLRSSDPDETAADLVRRTSPSIAGMVRHLRGPGSRQVSEIRGQRWGYDAPERIGSAVGDGVFESIVTDVGRRLRQLSLDNPGLPSGAQQDAPGHLLSPPIGCYLICDEDRETGRFELRVADPIVVGSPVGSVEAIPYFLPDGRCRIQFVCTKEFDGTPNAGLEPADLALATQLQAELDAGRYFARFGWTNFDLLTGTGVDARFSPFTGQWDPDIAVLPGSPLVTDRVNGPDGPAATEAARFSWPLPLDVAPFGSSSVIFGDGQDIHRPSPDELGVAAEDAARLAEFDQRLRGGAAAPPGATSERPEASDPPSSAGRVVEDDAAGVAGYTPGWQAGVAREFEAFDYRLQQRMSRTPDTSAPPADVGSAEPPSELPRGAEAGSPSTSGGVPAEGDRGNAATGQEPDGVDPNGVDPDGVDPDVSGAGRRAATSGGRVVVPELARPEDPVGDMIAGGRPGPVVRGPDVGPGRVPDSGRVDPEEFDPNRTARDPAVAPVPVLERFPTGDEELEAILAPDGVAGLFTSPGGGADSPDGLDSPDRPDRVETTAARMADGRPAGSAGSGSVVEQPGGWRINSDGRRGVVTGSTPLVGDGRGASGSATVFTSAGGGSREVVIVSPVSVVDGVRTVRVPQVGEQIGYNPSGQVTSVQRLAPGVSGRVTAATPVTTIRQRVSPHSRRLAGTGAAGSVGGRVDYLPAPQIGQEIRVVTPSVTTLPGGDRVISALVPANRTLNAQGRPESFQVDITVPMVAQQFTVQAPPPSSPALLTPAADTPAARNPVTTAGFRSSATPVRATRPTPTPTTATVTGATRAGTRSDPRPGPLQQLGNATNAFINGPVTLRPLDGDPVTTAGMERFEATYLNGDRAVYSARTGNRISGSGLPHLPTWQRPIPPAMLAPAAGRLLAPAARLLAPLLGPIIRLVPALP